MNRNGMKAVFFDVGGTLLTPYPSVVEVYTRALEPLGIEAPPEELRRAYLDTWAEFDALVGPGRDRYSFFGGGEREYWRRYVRRVLERVDRGDDGGLAADALRAAFSDPRAWTIFPEVAGTLRTLRERGYRLGVISNWDSRLRALLTDLGLAGQFDSITVSCEVGVEKPHPAIYRSALEALGVGAGETLHVGDDPVSDFDGPRALGMQAAVVVRDGSGAAGARAVPPPRSGVPRIASLAAVPGLLDRSNAPAGAGRGEPGDLR